MSHHLTYYLLLPLFLFTSCTSVHDAQHTLAVADSLRAEGLQYADSLSLSQAVLTFKKHRLLHPNGYAKANYYYSRLLRNQGNYPQAMQCFIDATHSHSHDHNTLGRVYSNMGTICHLANEFALSYQMYEQSAAQFKRANNTIAYYYALNDMALELAEQGITNDTYNLLNDIRQYCFDTAVIAKTWETEAILFAHTKQYDSTIYAVNHLQQLGNQEPTGYVLKARAFWYKEQYDSAYFYAKYVIDELSVNDSYRYDMLYIVANTTPIEDNDEFKQIVEQRSDIDSDILDPMHEQLIRATDMLQQSLNDKSHFINIFLLILSICLIAIISFFSIKRIRLRNKQSTADIEEKQKQLLEQTTIELQKQNILISEQDKLMEENKTLQQINDTFRSQYEQHKQHLLKEIEDTCNLIRQSSDWRKEVHWKDYEELCDFMNRHFFMFANKLKTIEELSEKETRTCFLILLDIPLSNKQLAQAIYYGETGIGTFKYRLSKKFKVQTSELRNYLLKLAISETPPENNK